MTRQWDSGHDDWAVYGERAPADDATTTRWLTLVDDDTPHVRLITNSALWFWGALGALHALSFANPLASSAIPIAGAVGIAAIVTAAFRDRTVLKDRGAHPVASPLWMLLSPVAYLIARRHILASSPGQRYGFLGWYLIGLGAVIGCVMFFVAVQGLVGAAGAEIPSDGS